MSASSEDCSSTSGRIAVKKMEKPNNRKNKKKNKFKKYKVVYKFDIKQILKEREADKKKTAEFDGELRTTDELPLVKIANIEEDIEQNLPTSKNVHNGVNYNMPFNDDPDIGKSCLQRLHILSLEENEFMTHIHFNTLINTNWTPMFEDVKNILCNWSTDFVSLVKNESLPKSSSSDYKIVGRHNFDLVLKFLTYSVQKMKNGFRDNDLLTLANFVVNMYFDPHCGQMINVIKKLFSTCIETVMHKKKPRAITLFAQEFYSNHSTENLSKMVVDLFLPIEGDIMKKIYSYLTYALFKSYLEITNKRKAFPSNINDWFVQDLVSRSYFKENPITVIYNVIHLLEHVVIVFDLYANEEKLNEMHHFLKAALKQIGLLNSNNFVNILDQWRLRLFRLHVDHIIVKTKAESNLSSG